MLAFLVYKTWGWFPYRRILRLLPLSSPGSRPTIRWNGPCGRSADGSRWLMHFRMATRHWCWLPPISGTSQEQNGEPADIFRWKLWKNPNWWSRLPLNHRSTTNKKSERFLALPDNIFSPYFELEPPTTWFVEMTSYERKSPLEFCNTMNIK